MHRRFFIPLEIWNRLCVLVDISLEDLQRNIVAYKTAGGPNYVSSPILPVKITPIFDMIIAHNIADGGVIDPKRGRLPYFGYRQFDPLFRILYIQKIESVFGTLNFPRSYYLTSTRPYCPPVLASLFFKIYNLNTRSFLSRTARIPPRILNKDKPHLLATLIAFIIDEGHVDSTLIYIKLKNPLLATDLLKICEKLGYSATLTIKEEYGAISILRSGMKKFFEDYKLAVHKCPQLNLGKIETKIKNSFKIYNRPIYKTKGNKEHILQLIKNEDLTVNQIALRINMTRQGVRFHINNLEKEHLIFRSGETGEKNIVYRYGDVLHVNRIGR